MMLEWAKGAGPELGPFLLNRRKCRLPKQRCVAGLPNPMLPPIQLLICRLDSTRVGVNVPLGHMDHAGHRRLLMVAPGGPVEAVSLNGRAFGAGIRRAGR